MPSAEPAGQPAFSHIAILGLGLIGGSLASALKTAGYAGQITAFDQNPESLRWAHEQGLIDWVPGSAAQAVGQADLVILAVPVMAAGLVLADIEAHLGGDVVLTDVGSVKGQANAEVAARLPHLYSRFVGGHPIAGSERHGVTAAIPDLFQRHAVILTPTGETDRQALDKVSRLWQFVGAEVKLMSPAHHDEVLAQTSHLPHLLAYGLIDTLSRQGDSLEIFEYAAGGLRDFSRIAASDPTMWRDIFQSNRDAVLSSLDQFLTELNVLRGYIEQGEVDELMAVFARSKVARDHFSRLLADRQKPDDTD